MREKHEMALTYWRARRAAAEGAKARALLSVFPFVFFVFFVAAFVFQFLIRRSQ